MKTPKSVLMCASLLMFPIYGQSEEGVYVYPQVAIAEYSNASALKSEALYGLGVGYRFSGPVAIEFDYLTGDSSVKSTVGSASPSVDVWDVRGLYHFLESDKLSPYVSLGVGRQKIDLPGIGSESQVNGGLGLRYMVMDNLDFRTSYNLYDGAKFGDLKRIFNIGLHYRFGAKQKPMPVKAASIDTDGDGVLDTQDSCSDTSAGAMVDARGCRVRADVDRDGVEDVRDQCLGTTDRSRRVDSSGCYVVEFVDVPMQLETEFHFAFDSSATTPAHQAKVKGIVDFIRQGSDSSVELSGHADSTGPSSYNQGLAQQRVDSIRALLEDSTDNAIKILSSQGYGEDRPVASNDTKASRKENRRVDAMVRIMVRKQKQ